MLYSFEFSNSCSFLERQDFNLVRPVRAANRSAHRWPSSGWRHDISPVAAVFGANASGKSGLVRSLAYAIKNRTFADDVAIAPFGLSDDEGSPPVHYDLRFEAPNFTGGTKRCEYHYRFTISMSGTVLFEELRYYPKGEGKSVRVFLREGDASASQKYRWGQPFRGEKAFLVRITQPKELFLGNTRVLEDNPLAPVIDWLDDYVLFYTAAQYEAEFSRIKARLYEDPSLLGKVVTYIQRADLGIVDLTVAARNEETLNSYRRSLESEGVDKDLIARMVKDFSLELTFIHASPEGTFEFHEHMESDGTRAMLSFASIAIDALEKGSVIVIDEIDSSLHPLLVRELVRQFQSPKTNPRQAQLIFTTHDATLLHSPSWLEPLLERDQVWLVEKDSVGRSSLYSIADFPAREDENLFRKYLAGQYGSVPHPYFDTPTEAARGK